MRPIKTQEYQRQYGAKKKQKKRKRNKRKDY